ncbi:hypothetical protein Cgig2_007980 [Carnegiea gigantea]|uniref:DUF4283 domain-containing protein n=1 Tax=Carnegiea gigantea TaxID=171969 RepID=A0A9Q1GM56_9CARY|nr:hypothetical protein Cgig2_007980 [Carnegiea gigantea]
MAGGERGRLKAVPIQQLMKESSTPYSNYQQEDENESAMANAEASVANNLNATVTPDFPIEQNTQVSPQSSYASIVNQDEGTDLQFMPTSLINGFKYAKRIWLADELDKTIQVRKGVFLVRFVHLQDKMTVEKRGLFCFDSKPFLVNGWNPKMELHTESIKS